MIISGVTISGTSINDGYNLLTNNALLSLDAGNRASYPGSGTTWYDLSGNSWNATNLSNMTYSSNNGGYFSYVGNGSATLTSGVYNKPYTGKSVFVAVNCTAISNQFRAIVGNAGPGTRNFNFYLYNSGGQNYLHFSTNGGGGISNAIPYTLGNWATFGVSMNTAGTQTYYYNGNLVNTLTGGGYGQYAGGSTEYIGAADNYWYGYIAAVCVYGRYLSSTEHRALHGAVRNRYGI